MSYEMSMELAGAKVLKFREFGSYQGDWWALVVYRGKTGWVTGAYGSCSGCDSFQSEFDTAHDHGEDFWYLDGYNFLDGCETCNDLKKRIADFGREYLDNILTTEEAIIEASENIGWDVEADEMLKFIKGDINNG